MDMCCRCRDRDRVGYADGFGQHMVCLRCCCRLLELVGAGLELQICAFAVVSLVTMVIVRPVATRYLRGNIIATNADRMIHEVGLVTKDITAESWGEVKIKGALWSAVNIDSSVIPAGSKVKVMAIEGAKLIVREIDEG